MEEAQADLAELEPKLRLIPVRAFQRYNDKQREERALFRLRVQADVVHAYMEHEARSLLRTEWSVVLSPPSVQAFHFDVLGKWRLRLHKLNDDFTIENNRTRLALDFLEQTQPQTNLGLAPPPTNLHLGYRLNTAKSGLASVHMVCPTSEQEILWQYILPEPGEQGPEPLRGTPPTPPAAPRLRPAEPAERRQRNGESGA
jgi:hypothetical protein